ncbi:helix-turn-helix domain-containing protein [Rhodococcoides fascians]|uniref:helix-turn-helix domain-containing protein n=1 Tax=Rhodococcoides fascians TaxID=1828 RepID=UPI00050C86BB|nr:helix-turn-helix domain-containing protein [Rhodococcus fascians]
MTASPLFDLEDGAQPVGRFDWERVIRRVTVPPQAMFLGLVLATYANEDGSRVHPGTHRLARVMGVSVPTVKRGLSVLRETGFIQRVKQGNRWANQSDEYQLTVPPNLFDLELLEPDEGIGLQSLGIIDEP